MAQVDFCLVMMNFPRIFICGLRNLGYVSEHSFVGADWSIDFGIFEANQWLSAG